MYHVRVLNALEDVGLSISETKISEAGKKIVLRTCTRWPFLNIVSPIDGTRGSQKTFCPKIQGESIGIRPEYFSYKEIACAIQWYAIIFFIRRPESFIFLGDFFTPSVSNIGAPQEDKPGNKENW